MLIITGKSFVSFRTGFTILSSARMPRVDRWARRGHSWHRKLVWRLTWMANWPARPTLLCYGSTLAWLGMVLTRKKFRGQGLARRLLSETLALANQMKIETVKLDATDQGQPLYEKLGFRCEQPVERWERAATGSTGILNGRSGSLSPEHLIADRESFGADRSELLGRLAGRNGAFVA